MWVGGCAREREREREEEEEEEERLSVFVSALDLASQLMQEFEFYARLKCFFAAVHSKIQ